MHKTKKMDPRPTLMLPKESLDELQLLFLQCKMALGLETLEKLKQKLNKF